MRKIRLSFRLREDDRFVIRAQAWSKAQTTLSGLVTETIYDHEDLFLRLVIYADLKDELTRELVAAVILSVADPKRSSKWITAEITAEQNEVLGINLPPEPPGELSRPITGFATKAETAADLPFGFLANVQHIYDFFMSAPAPFAMFSGPNYIITFVNPPYLRIVGRSGRESLVGVPILRAFPELADQQCLALLDEAYKTGVPQVRRKLPCSLRKEETGLFEEVYFDIVYHPVRDASGEVAGVMAQATDVTERVLARQVSDNREQKLYRLWAELEAIYAAAPVGIAVIEASDLRLLRLNGIQAKLLNAPAENLVGNRVSALKSFPRGLLDLLERAASGERIANVIVDATSPTSLLQRRLSVSVRPALNEVGVVETLTLISLDVTGSTLSDDALVTQYST